MTRPATYDDKRRLYNGLLDIVASTLRYFENVEKITALKTASEVIAASEGGVQRYKTEPIYRAKVDTMMARLMEFLDTIQSEKPRNWISCDEQLPGGTENVLVAWNKKEGKYAIESISPKNVRIMARGPNDIDEDHLITHWMPLPEPPK